MAAAVVGAVAGLNVGRGAGGILSTPAAGWEVTRVCANVEQGSRPIAALKSKDVGEVFII